MNQDYEFKAPVTCPHAIAVAGLAIEINSTALMAVSILELVQRQFLEDGADKCNDDVIFHALESVIKNVNDINKRVDGYRLAALSNQQA